MFIREYGRSFLRLVLGIQHCGWVAVKMDKWTSPVKGEVHGFEVKSPRCIGSLWQDLFSWIDTTGRFLERSVPSTISEYFVHLLVEDFKVHFGPFTQHDVSYIEVSLVRSIWCVIFLVPMCYSLRPTKKIRVLTYAFFCQKENSLYTRKTVYF